MARQSHTTIEVYIVKTTGRPESHICNALMSALTCVAQRQPIHLDGLPNNNNKKRCTILL